MRRKCRGLIDLDKHDSAVLLQTAGENCHGFASKLSPQCGGYYGELQIHSHCPRHSSGLVRGHK